MVGSGTRKARAISAVVSPPSSRRVSATWTPVPSAGWQQVKIRRSRSSRTGPSSAGSSRACSRAAWACRSAAGRLPAQPVDRPVAGGGDDPAGRARRQAGRRPALHGRGERVLDRLLGDVDVAEDADQDGHRAAVLRAEDPLDLGGGQGRHAGRSVLGRVLERPHLDRAAWSPGRACRPQPSAASRSGALTMVNPPMCSLPSVNGPSVDQHLAVADAHHRGRARRVQPAGEDPGAGRPELRVQGVEVAHDPLQHLGRRRLAVGLVDAEQVLLSSGCSSWRVVALPVGRLVGRDDHAGGGRHAVDQPQRRAPRRRRRTAAGPTPAPAGGSGARYSSTRSRRISDWTSSPLPSTARSLPGCCLEPGHGLGGVAVAAASEFCQGSGSAQRRRGHVLLGVVEHLGERVVRLRRARSRRSPRRSAARTAGARRSAMPSAITLPMTGSL